MRIVAVLAVFVLLQTLDVYTTLAAGGLAVEANPIAIYLWQTGGIVVALAAKVAVAGIICVAWGIYGLLPELRCFRWILGILVTIGSAIPVGWNISVIGR